MQHLKVSYWQPQPIWFNILYLMVKIVENIRFLPSQNKEVEDIVIEDTFQKILQIKVQRKRYRRKEKQENTYVTKSHFYMKSKY